MNISWLLIKSAKVIVPDIVPAIRKDNFLLAYLT